MRAPLGVYYTGANRGGAGPQVVGHRAT